MRGPKKAGKKIPEKGLVIQESEEEGTKMLN